MAKKLSQIYKKFLYGGEQAQAESSLYGSVRLGSTKTTPVELPSSLSTGMSGLEFPQAAKAVRESLVIPRADDVQLPEVKDRMEVSQMTPVLLSNPEYAGNQSKGTGAFNITTFKQELANVESNGGNYKAVNPKSSASGKYQFLWNTWNPSITKVTGVKSKKEFLNNPQAQEQFMDHYTKTTVMPAVTQLRKLKGAQDFSDSELGKLVHFQGVAGARSQVSSGKLAEKTKTNLSVKEYFRRSRGV